MLIGAILVLSPITKRKKRIKTYFIITFIQLTLIAGLRAKSVGWDTASYLSYYRTVELNNSIVDVIVKTRDWTEPGFFILCFVVKILGGNGQIALLVSGAITYGLLLNFIHKYAYNPIIGVMSIFCFPVFYDSLSMLRNAIVCSMFLYSIKYIEEKNIGKYLICTLIALSLHTFSVIFLPLYFVPYINWKRRRNLALILGLVVLVYARVMAIAAKIVEVFGITHYNQYISSNNIWFGSSRGGIKTAFFYLIIVMFGYYLFKKHNSDDDIEKLLVGYALLLPAAAFCYNVSGMFIRVMLLFMPIAGVFVSNEIQKIKHMKKRVICNLGFSVLLIAFQVFTLSVNSENYIPYILFWRG